MNDAEIRSAVEWHRWALDNLVTPPEGVKALQKAVELMTRYLELGGVVEEKEVLYKLNPSDVYANDYYDAEQKAKILHERSKDIGYNLGRQNTLLAMMKRLEGVTPELLHGLYLESTKQLNPESYNPNAQKSYEDLTEEQKSMDIYIATAICNHIANVSKTIGEE